ncbi:AAA family ATPase [Methylobacterium sp. E-045]|uniref:AAA family ATPase n=1 Tax=Methylobacterium sp. E-045 TaxID=2836575 RepID=UPI001FBBE287|nr:AAA family ATPase [Methylobacterium sp. E-045]MCJ2130889.1 AAA family ATPase [Methylobacterium sp. E-045]
MNEMNFADTYRPRVFSDIFGQESAVACLSGLIKRGQCGRHLQVHGSSGSGKTSVVQIYARALNCEVPAADGSPCCDHCEPCRGFTAGGTTYFHVFNVSRRGGGVDQIRQWVSERNREERVFSYRILFFDEAHALTAKACDALLDCVDHPAEGVLFFFATTEIERLNRALRSRLFDLKIRSLSVSEAVGFLRRTAKKARINYEPGALELLAGLRNPFPRDLLLGLERVHNRERPRVTVEQVRAAFDADQTDVLVAYFLALGAGQLDQQVFVLRDWREDWNDKVRWIQSFLVSLYHNDILHQRLELDGLIDAIPESARRSIVTRFWQRLRLASPAELAPIWCAMMEFWVQGEPARDDTSLALRLTLFHQLINAAEDGALDRKPAVSVFTSDTAATVTAPQGFAPTTRSLASLRGEPDEPDFLTAQDVRQIVNCASFLVQEYDLFFNAAFEIRPALAGAQTQAEAIQLIEAFRDDLAAEARDQGGAVFASITVIERDGLGVVGHLVAHVSLLGAALESPEAPDGMFTGPNGLKAWIRTWRRPQLGVSGVVQSRMAPAGETSGLAFHWDVTLALCGGLPDGIEVWDRTREEYRSLSRLLGIRARPAGPIHDAPRVSVSEWLSDAAIARACEHRLAPLSAFDDGAFAEIRTGWERSEHADRIERRSRRADELQRIRQRGHADPDAARAEIDAVIETWSPDPHERPRRWRGWW